MAFVMNKIEMRVSPIFGLYVRIDLLMSRFGINLPMSWGAWVLSKAMQAKINGKWQAVPLSVEEVRGA